MPGGTTGLAIFAAKVKKLSGGFCAVLSLPVYYLNAFTVPAFYAGAKVYDLDSAPIGVKPWTQLENVQAYYSFFKAHEKEFRS